MINVISIFLCVCKFILVVAQSGTDHCQLATGQNAHSRNVLFFSRTFSDLISVGGFRNEKKRQIKSDVEPNERRLHRAAGPQKPGCQAGSSCSGMAFGARFPGIAVCPRAKLSCILNKRQPIIRAYVQTGILFIHVHFFAGNSRAKGYDDRTVVCQTFSVCPVTFYLRYILMSILSCGFEKNQI